MTSIFTTLYEREQLNARDGRRTACGMLIQITWPSGAVGYSDLMPLRAAGDLTLEESRVLVQRLPIEALWSVLESRVASDLMDLPMLVALQEEVLRVVEAPEALSLSIFHNLLDAAWRRQGVHGLRTLRVPRSHRLIDSTQCATIEDLQDVLAESASNKFPAVKIKGVGSSSEKLRLLSTVAALTDAPIPIRLDFNQGLTFDELQRFLQERQAPLNLRCVDFIEDPCAYHPAEWRWLREHGVPIASDLAVEGPVQEAAVAVVKPVRNPLARYIAHTSTLCVTHCMDSKLGQSVAAFWAALLARELPARTTYPGLVEEQSSPQWPHHMNGAGFGLQRELEGMPWQPLSIG